MLISCFGLTVVFDMVVVVTVGIVLAALLFMRRMAEIADVRPMGRATPTRQPLPPDVASTRSRVRSSSARPRRP